MKEKIFRKNRQTMKTTFLILIFAIFYLPMSGQTQNNKSKIDYSKKSNILNPDTLRGDQRKIFWHSYFLKLSYEEARNAEPLIVKRELAKLGITLNDDKRFIEAFNFFDTDIAYHKKSCENWEYFKDLAPKSD